MDTSTFNFPAYQSYRRKASGAGYQAKIQKKLDFSKLEDDQKSLLTASIRRLDRYLPTPPAARRAARFHNLPENITFRNARKGGKMV